MLASDEETRAAVRALLSSEQPWRSEPPLPEASDIFSEAGDPTPEENGTGSNQEDLVYLPPGFSLTHYFHVREEALRWTEAVPDPEQRTRALLGALSSSGARLASQEAQIWSLREEMRLLKEEINNRLLAMEARGQVGGTEPRDPRIDPDPIRPELIPVNKRAGLALLPSARRRQGVRVRPPAPAGPVQDQEEAEPSVRGVIPECINPEEHPPKLNEERRKFRQRCYMQYKRILHYNADDPESVTRFHRAWATSMTRWPDEETD